MTSDQLVTLIAEEMQRWGARLCKDLQKNAEETWGSLTPDEIAILGHEVFLAHLWMVSNTLAPYRSALDTLHDGYFKSRYHSGATHEEGAARANAAQTEVSERYDRYYKALETYVKSEGKGRTPGYEMCQFFFPRRRPVIDIDLQMRVQLQVAHFMKAMAELKDRLDQLEVKDA